MLLIPCIFIELFIHDTNKCTLLCTNTFFIAPTYEGWNFNSGNYLFTTDTK